MKSARNWGRLGMKFNRYTLSDLATIKYGKNQKKVLSDSGTVPIFGTGGLMGFATTSLYDKPSVLIGRKGTIGKVKYVEQPFWTVDTLFYTIINTDLVIPKYLFYVMSLIDLNNYNEGTTIPSLRTETLNRLEFDIPDLDEQRKILSCLNPIDEKIELNNEINNNLFEQMQALYKAWFVDFEPFGGVRPSNWNDTNIYAIANIIYGAPFASKLFNTDGLGKPIIRIRDLKEQAFVTFTTEEHPKGHLIQPGDIVVGMDGEFRPYIWGNEPAWLNQRVCIFESNRPQGKAFVLYTIKPLLNKIEQTQVATTVIHIGKKDFDAFEIVLPDEATLDSFDSITAPMIEQIVNNRLQNKRLAVLRDTLLPKLMSSELDVSNIEL